MKGRIEFECSDPVLTQGFAWAKEQALAYSHEKDLVGDWYEAALPNREAFCMRDVSHQARGAHLLGLEKHTKNMLLRFAQSIAESRDFCCFWEIDRNYRPAPVDYTSDDDFWYNLPANFDMLDACYRMYLLTDDPDYIRSSDFLRFYDLSMNEYIKRWDSNADGIPDAKPGIWRRGIPSYNEAENTGAAHMLDLICVEQRAFRSYAEIKKLIGDTQTAEKAAAFADKLCEDIDKNWWDSKKERFYLMKMPDGTYKDAEHWPCEAALYFGAINDLKKLALALDELHNQKTQNAAVEPLSHFSEIFYRYGDVKRGEFWLRTMIDPNLPRRDYPELSYAVIGDYIYDLMGIHYDLKTKSITVHPNLPDGVTYAAVHNLPVYGQEADVIIENGVSKITLH